MTAAIKKVAKEKYPRYILLLIREKYEREMKKLKRNLYLCLILQPYSLHTARMGNPFFRDTVFISILS